MNLSTGNFFFKHKSLQRKKISFQLPRSIIFNSQTQEKM